MSHLALTLFGQFQATLDSRPLTNFPSDKVRALLAYLVTESSLNLSSTGEVTQKLHSRGGLASLFWPGYPEQSALTSLRQALYHLRKTLGDDKLSDETGAFLQITRQTVAFHPKGACTTDIHTFGEWLALCAAHPHPRIDMCPACLERLQLAITLYQGDFLAGFAIHDSTSFEEWRRVKQEQYHIQALDALTYLTSAAMRRADYERARQLTLRQLALEPWREEAHRQLMRALTYSGDRSAALAHYQACRQTLRDELGVEPDANTTRLYEQIRSGDFARNDLSAMSNRSPAVDALSATRETVLTSSSVGHEQPQPPQEVPSSLPLMKSSANPVIALPLMAGLMVGRENQLQTLLQIMADPQPRLISLVGLGGVGKTRLAAALAQAIVSANTQNEQSQRYPAMVSFVSLANISGDHPDPATAISQTILQALHVTPNSTSGPREQLLHLLRDFDLLLILDNFEHLVYAKAFLDTLLQAASRLRLLITSRTRLNLVGETVIRLTGLPFPTDDHDPEAASYSSVQFFMAQAHHAWSGFTPDASTLPTVVGICRIVNGMPLAIELAASWVQHFTCAEIVQTLQENLSLLENTVHAHPERHHTLYAVIESSWLLLTPAEQHLLATLSLFHGAFRRSAALAVSTAKLTDLANLVDKSLVQQTSSPGWYSLHALVRQFAAEKLSDAERRQAQVHYIDYYSTFLQSQLSALKSKGQQQAVEEILLAIDNVLAAWNLAVRMNDVSALGMAQESLWYFSHVQGRFLEGETLFALAAKCLVTLIEEADTPSAATLKPVLGQMLGWQGWFCMQLGRYQRALELGRQSLDLLAANPGMHERNAIYVHASNAFVHHYVGREAVAVQEFEEALRLALHFEDDWANAFCHFFLEMLKWPTRRYGRSQRHFETSLHQLAATGDPWLQAECLFLLGEVYVRRGEYVKAEAALQEGLLLSQQSRYRTGIGYCHLYLGEVAQARGQLDQARQYYQQSVAIFAQSTDDAARCTALRNLGMLALEEGKYDEVNVHLQACLRISELFGIPGGKANNLLCLGQVALHLSDPLQANTYLVESLKLAQTLTAREELLAACHAALGVRSIYVAELQTAEGHLRQALTIAAEIDAPPLALDILLELVAFWMQHAAHPPLPIDQLLRMIQQHPASRQKTRNRAAALLGNFTV